MRLYGRDFQGFAKWLVVSATALLIASGLCGLQYAVLSITGYSPGGVNTLAGIFMITGIVELLAMAVAAIGIVAVALTWLAFTIFRIPLPGQRGENLSILRSGDEQEKSEKDSQ